MRYFSGPYTQGQLLREITEIETAITENFDQGGAITDTTVQRDWRERVKEASFGKNTVLFDDQGNPSIMVLLPSMTRDYLLGNGDDSPHYAFIVNGNIKPQIYVAKYQCFVVGSGIDARALSLRHKVPGVNIDFDTALSACTQKGTGWHLNTNATWAAIALWCKKQGFWPRGNNNYGKDHQVGSEKGIPGSYYDDSIEKVLTGSGPVAWSHDGTPFGIYDLNGNVWEWVGGLRLDAGEIQIFPDNNAADDAADHSSDSSAWQAILEDGSLVSPGTADTLKYDFVNSPSDSGDTEISKTTQDNPDDYYGRNNFSGIAVDNVSVPDILKLMGLAPIDSEHGGDGFWMRNTDERLPRRGASWAYGSDAGVFALSLILSRSYSNRYLGFRAAFVL